MLYSEYPFVLGTGQKNNFQYRWVPGTGSKKILGTDGYPENFHLCRPLPVTSLQLNRLCDFDL